MKRNILTIAIYAVLFMLLQTDPAGMGKVFAQESVRRPSEVETNFEEFKVTLEEMNKLETTMDVQLRVIEDDLSSVEKEIASLPKNSKKRAVAAEKWEGLVSEALLVRMHGLTRLRDFRDRAISLLDNVIRKDPNNRQLSSKIEKQIAEMKESIAKTEKDITNFAITIEYGSGADDDKRQLIRELEFNQDIKLPAQQRQAQWLADWQKQFEKSPAASQKGKLREMLSALKNRFIEFDMEIQRIKVIAESRKTLLATRIEMRKLVEVLNAFNDYAAVINAAVPSNNKIVERINTKLWQDITPDQMPPDIGVTPIESSSEPVNTSNKPGDYRERIARILNKKK